MNLKVSVGEIETAQGRALTEERFRALRRQVPIIYLLAVVNIWGLELTTDEDVALGWNAPTLFLVCALVRSGQWIGAVREISPAMMLRRLRQTFWLAAIVCLSISLWSMHLLQVVDPEARIAVLLFSGLTAVGVAYGLSALPSAACVPLIVLALPLAAAASTSRDPHLTGAAVSLAMVTVLILRLLALHNRQFVDVVRSRAQISSQQALAEQAREDAVAAATTDFLTELPNRRAFVGAVETAIHRSQDSHFAIAILDLDRFKAVNDTFGHGSGDELLKIVARRLVRVAGARSVVARLGGDEFGLLFPDVRTADEARWLGTAILAEVNRPAVICGRNLAVIATCGIAVARASETGTPSDALADADVALYEAKKGASDHLAIFQPHMHEPRRRRSDIERALQSPSVHESISLAFQPIVDLQNGQIVANEALARWRHDELGEVSPSEFVPAAEGLEMIGNISDYLFAEAVAEACHWHPSVRLSFNVSAVQLCSGGLSERILNVLESAGFPGERLQIEVTETALLADFTTARRNLDALRSVGTLIVLDDFGAGYASIGYLREIQFDQIKLDGALVTAAVGSAEGERLLGAVIGLCRALDVATVAEHVESEEQLKLLLKLGCKLGQGFWLHPPSPPELARHLSSSQPAAATPDMLKTRRSAA